MVQITASVSELQEALDRYIANPQAKEFQGPALQHVARNVTWAFDDIRPAAPLYVTADMSLRVTLLTAQTGFHVRFRGRMLIVGGEVVPFEDEVFTDGTVGVYTKTIRLWEGFLMDLQVIADDSNFNMRAMWVQAQLGISTGINFIGTHTLIAEHAGPSLRPSWPGGTLRRPNDGPGLRRSFSLEDPVVGALWTTTVPLGEQWQLTSVRFLFQTSAVAGTRNVRILLRDSYGSSLTQCLPVATQGPGSVVTYFYSRPGNPLGVAGDQRYQQPLADCLLDPLSIVSVTVAALDAGDAFTGIAMGAQTWPAP